MEKSRKGSGWGEASSLGVIITDPIIWSRIEKYVSLEFLF